MIKSCFQAPPGYLLIGLDYSSLEDKISALLTKDRNKLKVYTDGYCGHCLRAYSYYKDQMPDINESVDSINSIAKLYPKLRQASKTPSFALQYLGTYITLMKNSGFSEEEAKSIEARFHELYTESGAWVEDKIQKATVDGYVIGAFGLRVRTPLLNQVIRGNSKTPFEAEAEGRTAANALSQSYCMLNSRSSAAFMKRSRKDWGSTIKPLAQIHDAFYMLIPDDLEIIQYVNKHLVEETLWQDDPAIWHEQVKLGGELSVFFPSWAEEMTIPNEATDEEILSRVDTHINSL